MLLSEVVPAQVCKCKDIECFLLPGAGRGGGAGRLQYKLSLYADDATSDLTTERLLCSLSWVPELSRILPSQKQCGLIGSAQMGIPLLA